MNTQQNKPNNTPLWIAALCFVAWLVVTNFKSGPIDDPKRPEGPELYSIFSQSPNALEAGADAKTFGDLTAAVAAHLEYDGSLPEPRINTGLQVDDLRRWSREYVTHGQSYRAKYPALVEAVKVYLDQHAGTSGGPLDDAKRRAWSKALRDISGNAHYAAKRLGVK